MKVDFFTDNARLLLALLETQSLEFKTLQIDKDVDAGYFERINDKTDDKMLDKLFSSDKKYFSSYEMDDFLLMHLEDLGILYEKKIVPIYDVDQLFDYYIETLFENCQVKKYIDWARQDDKDIYSKFESLYHELKIYLNKA